MKIVYSQKYLNYHFDPGHPFWPERARQFVELLKSRFKFKFKIVEAPRATDGEILLVHTKDYLERLKKMVKQGGGYLSVDTPVNKDNFEAAYYYVGGTVEAAKLALKGQQVVNTLGGLHHAETNSSSGFCIFNDHAIAIRKLQKGQRIKKAAVLDLDVHAGNGTQEIFYSDPTVLKISIHQDPTFFYPGTGFAWQTGEGRGKGFNINYPLQPGTGEPEYLDVLDEAISRVKDFKPDILVVILGVDTYKNDSLASIQLEKESYAKIAKRLKDFSKKTVLFAGGYSQDVPELWYEFVKALV
jgi:acetoin utilization protein AcuC